MGEVRGLVVLLLLGSALLVGATTFYAEIGENYGVSDADDLDTLTSANKTFTMVQNMQNSTTNIGVTTGTIIDIPLSIASGAYSSFMLVFQTIDLFGDMISEMSSAATGGIIVIPAWFTTLLIQLVSITIIFTAINALLKWDV